MVPDFLSRIPVEDHPEGIDPDTEDFGDMERDVFFAAYEEFKKGRE